MAANERRMAILQTLCRQGEASATALAAEYRVSTRTIRSDLIRLSRVYPIITKMGRNGGYIMADWHPASSHRLTAAETDLLYRIHKTLDGDDALMMSVIISKVCAGPVQK